MINQNLIIFNLKSLFKIFKEFEDQLKCKLYYIKDINDLNNLELSLKDYLIISSQKIRGLSNELIVCEFPYRISQIIEKINLQILKSKFIVNSKLKIRNYALDLNSRILTKNESKINLTEKECKIISYLLKANKGISIGELQSVIWDYNVGLETHTVETHIYRLRKKIFDIFKDKDFIASDKNGYFMNL